MFRDFGSAPAGSRIRRGATEDEEGCQNCPSGRGHGPIRRASGPSPGVPGFEGGSGCTWGFRIEPRQIALIGTIRGVGHVVPDPIPPPIQPSAKMRLSGAPGGLRIWELSLLGRIFVAVSVSRSSRTASAGFASSVGFDVSVRYRIRDRGPRPIHG